MTHKVVAIIVAYFPDFEFISRVVESLRSQNCHVVIVDNTDHPEYQLSNCFPGGVMLITVGKNIGIASALNLGICSAESISATHVLLLDQDSFPTIPFIDTLLDCLSSVCVDHKIAAVGPSFIDATSGQKSDHVKFSFLKIGRIKCNEGDRFVSSDFLITSGTLIPMPVILDVGLMDDTLFIDHVDTEWCLRAKSKGYELLGDCVALMEHNLGEYRKRIWFFRWREVPVHKAFRYYYIFRNSVLLYRRKYISWSWIRIDLIRLVQIFGFTLLFGPDRLGKIAMMFRGVRDAFLGITGKLGSKG